VGGTHLVQTGRIPDRIAGSIPDTLSQVTRVSALLYKIEGKFQG